MSFFWIESKYSSLIRKQMVIEAKTKTQELVSQLRLINSGRSKSSVNPAKTIIKNGDIIIAVLIAFRFIFSNPNAKNRDPTPIVIMRSRKRKTFGR